MIETKVLSRCGLWLVLCGACSSASPSGAGNAGAGAGDGGLGNTDAGACVPTSCAALGFRCGPASDGCGGSLACGTCTAPQTCGGDGNPNVCGGGQTLDDGGPDSSTDASGSDGGLQGTVIFTEPSYASIAGHFFAPLCKTGLGAGPIPQSAEYAFSVRSWQCPITTGFVIDSADAASLTGFNPNGGSDLGNAQVGYANTATASVAQMAGTEVGIYMDSDDLAGYTTCPSPSNPDLPNQGCKMMMTPEIDFPVGLYKPFATGNTVVVSFELQIVTAETNNGSEAYATSDLLFQDTSGAIDSGTNSPYQFSYGESIFNTHDAPASCNTSADAVTGNIIVGCPMLSGQPYSSNFALLPGSTPFQKTTWTGLMPFSYSISSDQFANALAAAKLAYPKATFSTLPSDYALVQHHANFELNKYELGRSRLGYSIQNLTIALQ